MADEAPMSRGDYYRAQKEAKRRNDDAFDALAGPPSVALRRLDISEQKREQSCRHDGIDPAKTYLALVGGRWRTGRFDTV